MRLKSYLWKKTDKGIILRFKMIKSRETVRTIVVRGINEVRRNIAEIKT